MRIRSKREAYSEADRLETLARIERHKRETGYDKFWHHGIGVQSVCQMCFAVVTDRAGHTAWHAALGQEWAPATDADESP